ncbi:hypothetical protein CKA32_000262 [Geitlerinema sp. FC II]|nr:hypothetical protein CKA32_000262 [Geitlerinema sp. FC II]
MGSQRLTPRQTSWPFARRLPAHTARSPGLRLYLDRWYSRTQNIDERELIRNPHTITPLKAIAQNRFKS